MLLPVIDFEVVKAYKSLGGAMLLGMLIALKKGCVRRKYKDSEG